MNVAKERDISIDLLSGIFICYMIYTHICQKLLLDHSFHYLFLDSFLYFFMPWFFFKSGMFYKKSNNNSKELTKIFKRLVVPLVVFGIANLPLFILSIASAPNNDPFWLHFMKSFALNVVVMGSPFGLTPMWFLSSLIIIRLYMLVIKRDKLLLLSSFVFVVISYLLWKFHIPPMRLFVSPLLGFFFFYFGYMMKSYHYNKSVYLFSLSLFLIIIFLCPSHLSIRSNEIYGGGYSLAILSSICGILTVNNLSRLAVVHITIDHSFFLCRIGEDSMYYYAIHMIYLDLWYLVLTYLNINYYLIFILLPITLVISKRIHFLEKYTR